MNQSTAGRLAVGVAAALIVVLTGFGRGWAVDAAGAEVAILGHNAERVSALTDGDAVRVRLTLPEAARAATEVSFRLEAGGAVVATCEVAAGERECETAEFYSLGWHWDEAGAVRGQRMVEAWAGGRLRAVSAPVQVAPRPVVMVHGFNSNWQTWSAYLGPDGYLAGMGVPGFAVGDGQAAGVMNTGQVTNPTARTNTIAENADILRGYIAEVKQQTGAEQVDLVAHSMGGLISRYYLDRVMEDRDVGQFITLGTPNAGTDCASLPGALGMLHPATLEIRPSYVNGIFNPQVTHLRGVPYHAVAGTSVEQAVGAPCTQTPTDLLVSLDSAGALPVEVLEVPFLHHELNKAPEVFETVVKPLLQTPPGSFTAAEDPVVALAGAETLAFARVFTGNVVRGASTAHTIQIEPGITVASFALFDASNSLTVSVRGASGNVILLDPTTNGVVSVDDPETLVHLGYGFSNPSPGAWAVTLAATANTPDGGADYALTAYLEGGAALQAEASVLLPRMGETVKLTGALRLGEQTVPIDRAQAVIRDAAGGATVVELATTGGELDGSWTPIVAGPHAIDIVASGRLADGTVVERSAFLAVEAQPRPNLLPTYVLLGAVCVLGVGGLGALALAGRWVWRRRRG